MIFRVFFLITSVGISYCFTVPKVITSPINKYHRHCIICKQYGKDDDYSNNISIDPDDMPFPTTKFKQTRQIRRSVDFPPSTYSDNLNDLPLELGSPIVKFARETRLVKERSYARRDAFESENISSRPTLDDLSPPIPQSPENLTSKLWTSASYRIGVLAVAYYSFPPLTRMLERSVTITPDSLNEITSKFAPGVSILYGTFISLTLSILYDRTKNVQQLAAAESSLISFMAQNMLTIFRNDEERIVRGGQCIADQIRILV